mgnify:CR=1 FL=1
MVQAWYRQQARAQGYADARCGSVTFVQRFGSALNLNIHFQMLWLDGVYEDTTERPQRKPRLRRAQGRWLTRPPLDSAANRVGGSPRAMLGSRAAVTKTVENSAARPTEIA